MIVIPTLDLRDGVCVYTSVLANDREEVSPLGNAFGVAHSWSVAGFRRLHVADLDAVAGEGSNEPLIEELLKDAACEIQVSGDIHTTDQIQRFVDAGATRVVLGSRAIEEPEWLANAADLFPGVLVVGTDVRERRVAMRGWVRTLPLDILDVVEDLSGLPLAGLLISSTQAGDFRSPADLALIEDVAELSEVPLIVRGGIAAMSDLRALEHRGVSAVLVGEALYTGSLDSHAVAQEYC